MPSLSTDHSGDDAFAGATSRRDSFTQTARRAFWRVSLNTPWSFRARWPFFGPLATLIAVTLLFRWTPLDLTISGWFYDAEAGQWPWFFSAPCTAFYRLGIYPPFVLTAIGGFLLIAGRFLDGTDTLPRAGLFLVLLMVIGPGLIVNLGLKGHWGRARPHQVEQFGGPYAYSPVGSPGPLPHGNSSFPSGHAAIAFYMMAPAFLTSRSRPGLAAWLFLAGTFYGICMSATRVIQGGHFITDVVWAGGIVYLLGVILARWLLPETPPGRKSDDSHRSGV
jgi:membrane-associated PAP2 superfamily phosphatase